MKLKEITYLNTETKQSKKKKASPKTAQTIWKISIGFAAYTRELAYTVTSDRLLIRGPNFVRIVHSEWLIASEVLPQNSKWFQNDRVKMYTINREYSR